MARSKTSLREWPHNGQPSSRHVWKELGLAKEGNGYRSMCLRCECRFHSVADTRAPVYCFPKPEWLATHPDDDRMLGAVRTPFG